MATTISRLLIVFSFLLLSVTTYCQGNASFKNVQVSKKISTDTSLNNFGFFGKIYPPTLVLPKNLIGQGAVNLSVVDTLNPVGPSPFSNHGKKAAGAMLNIGYTTATMNTNDLHASFVSQAIISAANTASWIAADSLYPNLSSFNAVLYPDQGATGYMPRLSGFYAGVGGQRSGSFWCGTVTAFDADFANGQTNNYIGFAMHNNTSSINSVALWHANSQSIIFKHGRWLIYDSLAYLSHMPGGLETGIDNYLNNIHGSFTGPTKIDKSYLDSVVTGALFLPTVTDTVNVANFLIDSIMVTRINNAVTVVGRCSFDQWEVAFDSHFTISWPIGKSYSHVIGTGYYSFNTVDTSTSSSQTSFPYFARNAGRTGCVITAWASGGGLTPSFTCNLSFTYTYILQ